MTIDEARKVLDVWRSTSTEHRVLKIDLADALRAALAEVDRLQYENINMRDQSLAAMDRLQAENERLREEVDRLKSVLKASDPYDPKRMELLKPRRS